MNTLQADLLPPPVQIVAAAVPRAGSCADDTSRDAAAAQRSGWLQRVAQSGQTTSTLASLVAHMLIAIGLGLWLLAVELPRRGVSLDVMLAVQGGGGSAGLGDDFGPGQFATTLIPETPAANDMVEVVQPRSDVGERLFADLTLDAPASTDHQASRLATGTGGLAAPGGTGRGSGQGRGDGHGDGIGDGQTEFFGLAGEGRKFVYVCDCSGSMSIVSLGPESQNEFVRIPWMAARAELLYSINQLNRQQLFGVIFYNHQVHPFDPAELYLRDGSRAAKRARRWETRTFAASEEMKQLATQFVTDFTPQGETEHGVPLELAIRMEPDVIYLLTDGEEKDDLTLPQVMWLTRLNKRRASINVVQFTQTPRPNNTMIELARRNSGQHVYVDISAPRPVGP